MSIELCVITHQAKMPSTKAWTQALKDRGLELEISDCDLLNQGGFMPVLHAGNSTGFEFDARAFNSTEFEDDELLAVIGTRDTTASFRFSREEEIAAALPCALVLARITDGIFYDPQEGKIFSDPLELEGQIEAQDPNFWSNLDPLIEPDSTRFPILAPDWDRDVLLLEKALQDFEARDYRLPPGCEELKIEGIPVLDLTLLPLVMIGQMLESDPNMAQIALLGRAIRAIDKMSGKLPSGALPYFIDLRKLCLQTVKACGFKETLPPPADAYYI